MNEYYKTCPYPKPQDKKKKKKVNGWKDKPNRYCVYCGKPAAERHELFGGPNRQISIDNGFQIDVCRAHHSELHANTSEWAQAENKRLKAEAQRNYMDKLAKNGMTEEEALHMWMILIRRNYIEELNPK